MKNKLQSVGKSKQYQFFCHFLLVTKLSRYVVDNNTNSRSAKSQFLCSNQPDIVDGLNAIKRDLNTYIANWDINHEMTIALDGLIPPRTPEFLQNSPSSSELLNDTSTTPISPNEISENQTENKEFPLSYNLNYNSNNKFPPVEIIIDDKDSEELNVGEIDHDLGDNCDSQSPLPESVSNDLKDQLEDDSYPQSINNSSPSPVDPFYPESSGANGDISSAPTANPNTPIVVNSIAQLSSTVENVPSSSLTPPPQSMPQTTSQFPSADIPLDFHQSMLKYQETLKYMNTICTPIHPAILPQVAINNISALMQQNYPSESIAMQYFGYTKEEFATNPLNRTIILPTVDLIPFPESYPYPSPYPPPNPAYPPQSSSYQNPSQPNIYSSFPPNNQN